MPPEWRVPATHFYPRPPRGGRPIASVRARFLENFYPRPPRGGRPASRCCCGDVGPYFYPRPPRGGRRPLGRSVVYSVCISIHALREEGDWYAPFWLHSPFQFLSTPSARRATDRIHRGLNNMAFLSTPSARRATKDARNVCFYSAFLSTPSARRATKDARNVCFYSAISIHALREEGDLWYTWGANQSSIFLSTPSARRATAATLTLRARVAFLSTPSARRATQKPGKARPRLANFYPRPPRGGRRREVLPRCRSSAISIHALREEGDVVYLGCEPIKYNFYPRPPRGGRRRRHPHPTGESGISIHALREEGDVVNVFTELPFIGFLSTPSARRATAKTERKPSAFVSLYTSLHKLQRGACKTNRKITPLLVQTADIPVRSVRENHVRCLFALAGHQKISTLSCANSGCSPTCSTLVW